MISASLILVWFAFFCDYALMTMVIPIFPRLGASDFMTGILFSSKAACQIMSSPLSSMLVDRHERHMIVGGLIVESLSCFVFFCTDNYGSWMAARGLSGVASTAIMSAGLAHIRRRYANDSDSCATAMGLATTGIMAGVVLGPVLGGTLYDIHPKLPFQAVAVLEILVAIATAAALPNVVAPTTALDAVSSGSMLRHPQVFRPLGALLVANAGISCFESTFARYGQDTFRMTASQVGAFYLITSVPSILFSGFSGPIGNYLGDRNLLLRLGLLIQGAFTILGPKDNIWLEFVSLIGLGVGMGIVDGSVNPILGDVADEYFHGTGRIFVLANTAVQAGFVVGPVLGNAVVQSFDWPMTCLVTGGALVLYAPCIVQKTATARESYLLLIA